MTPCTWVADWAHEQMIEGARRMHSLQHWPAPSDKTGLVPLYDQAAMDAAVAAERERCAQVADAHAEPCGRWGSANVDLYRDQEEWARAIAQTIRQLK